MCMFREDESTLTKEEINIQICLIRCLGKKENDTASLRLKFQTIVKLSIVCKTKKKNSKLFVFIERMLYKRKDQYIHFHIEVEVDRRPMITDHMNSSLEFNHRTSIKHRNVCILRLK